MQEAEEQVRLALMSPLPPFRLLEALVHLTRLLAPQFLMLVVVVVAAALVGLRQVALEVLAVVVLVEIRMGPQLVVTALLGRQILEAVVVLVVMEIPRRA